MTKKIERDTSDDFFIGILVAFLLALFVGIFAGSAMTEHYYKQYASAEVIKCVEDGGQYQADGEALYPSARCKYPPREIPINK